MSTKHSLHALIENRSMKTIKNITLLLIVGIIIMSCNKDQNNEIESELLTYFDSFELEAEARNLSIDIDNIDINGYVEDIEERGTLGQCKSYSDGSHTVVFDENYWDRITDLQREYLVFHELGHCILDRAHDDTKDANGNCNSIMQSGANTCKSIYSSENRTSLLDELFGS